MLQTDRLMGVMGSLFIFSGVCGIWASTLPTEHHCQVHENKVACVSRRGSHWPLLLAIGAGQIVGGAWLILPRKEEEGGEISLLPNFLQPNLAIEGIAGDFDWANDLIRYHAVMVVGGQGSGKSTLVKWLAERRLELGDCVIAVDPHAAYGQWEGLEVVGAGLNYAAVNEFMQATCDDIERRYLAIATKPDPDLPPITIINEEMTNQSDECDGKTLQRYDGKLSADIRKTGYKVIKVSHNDTLTTTGGKAGTKKIQDSYIRLYLESKPDPSVPDGVSPAFKGKLVLPNSDPIEVKINPNWKPCRLGAIPAPDRASHPVSTLAAPAADSDFNPLGNLAPDRAHLEKTLDLEASEIEGRVRSLHSQGLTQDLIIEAIWGCKKGSNRRYQEAREIYRRIVKLEA